MDLHDYVITELPKMIEIVMQNSNPVLNQGQKQNNNSCLDSVGRIIGRVLRGPVNSTAFSLNPFRKQSPPREHKKTSAL